MSSLSRSGSRELELGHLLDEQQPDIAVLTETELPAMDSTFAVKEYSVFYPDLHAGKYRILVLIKTCLVSQCNPAVLFQSSLDLWVKLGLKSGPLVIGAIYRQWKGHTQELEDLTTFHRHASAVAADYKRAVILGDVNLDMARKSDAGYYRFRMLKDHLEKMEDLGYSFLGPDTPTYCSYGHFDDGHGLNQRQSMLDHVYALGDVGNAKARTVPYKATDHLPVVASVRLLPPRTSARLVTRRNFATVSSSNLIMALNASNLSKVFLHDDVNVILDIIVEEIKSALDIIAPYKSSLIKDRPVPLYLKPDTLAAMRERDGAAGPGGDLQQYRALRNKVVRLLKRDKLDSNEKLLEKSAFDPKRVWNLANSTLGKRNGAALPSTLDGVSGDDKLAAHVNEFYVDKIAKLRDGITTQNKPYPAAGRENEMEDLFRLRPPSQGEVAKVILGLKNSGAIGEDSIPVTILKKGVAVLAAPLAHLVAVSISTAKVPDGFKLAKITPVRKKKKAADKASSYRPVAILSAMSKILERVVHRQLMDYVDKKFPNCQHGFRPRRNTVGAIIASHGEWAKAKTSGKVLGIAAYDLSAAFDTLDHGRLSDKLHTLGIRGKENDWFKHYLSGRFQSVVYNGTQSSYVPIKWGVPQGSILGPVLFLCLLVDLPDIICRSSVGDASVGSSGYADDCVVWASAADTGTVKANLESISTSIASYMDDHCLVLNQDKTQILWVGTGSGEKDPPIRVGESVVSSSSTVDILGVSYDARLSPAPHLAAVLRAARTLTAASRRLALHLRQPVLQQVVRSLLVGRIGYACAVLRPRLAAADPVQKDLAAIQTAINDCARAIVGSSRNDKLPIPSLLSQAGMPSLNRLIVEQIAVETWKGMNYETNGSKIPIGQILCPPPPHTPTSPRQTRARTAKCIPPPTKFKCETFAWHAYRLWNDSPPLRSATTLPDARRAAKELAALAPL